jgi:uncharacterized membrane protein YccC
VKQEGHTRRFADVAFVIVLVAVAALVGKSWLFAVTAVGLVVGVFLVLALVVLDGPADDRELRPHFF